MKLSKIIKSKINFLKLSLSISLIGILLLLFLANIIQPKLINIEQINTKLLNKKVRVQGQIFNIRAYEESNFQIISIKDSTGEIDITTNQILDLKNQDEIIVIGKLTEYEEFLQIQAEKILLN